MVPIRATARVTARLATRYDRDEAKVFVVVTGKTSRAEALDLQCSGYSTTVVFSLPDREAPLHRGVNCGNVRLDVACLPQ